MSQRLHIVDHRGRPLADDRDLFAMPSGLGEIISAGSSLAKGQQPWSFMGRYVLALLISGGAYLAIYVLIRLFSDSDRSLISLIFGYGVPFLIAVIVFTITWRQSAFRHTCTFLCQEGLARFTCVGQRDSVTSEILRFQDAQGLWISSTRFHFRHIYVRTVFHFVWVTAGGKFDIAGWYYSPIRRNKSNRSDYRYARAAESIWTDLIVRRLEAYLIAGGQVGFTANKKDILRIGRGFLEYESGDKVIRFDSPDSQEIYWTDGVLNLDRVDMVSRKKIEPQNICNCDAFEKLLDRWVLNSAASIANSPAAPTLNSLLSDMMNTPRQ